MRFPQPKALFCDFEATQKQPPTCACLVASGCHSDHPPHLSLCSFRPQWTPGLSASSPPLPSLSQHPPAPPTRASTSTRRGECGQLPSGVWGGSQHGLPPPPPPSPACRLSLTPRHLLIWHPPRILSYLYLHNCDSKSWPEPDSIQNFIREGPCLPVSDQQGGTLHL